MNVTVRILDDASPALQALVRSLKGSEKKDLNEQGARGAVNAAIKYHRKFNLDGGWKGPKYLGATANSGAFGTDVTRAWKTESVSTTGAVISNDSAHYRHKVDGGTIRPKRAKALTIPLILEAKGVRAAVYQQNTGRKLFTIKGRNFLFERIGAKTSGARGRKGVGATPIKTSRIRAVYALRKSVYQEPWEGALPDDHLLQDAYADAFMDGVEDIIERS
jgi:hypothetical protein